MPLEHALFWKTVKNLSEPNPVNKKTASGVTSKQCQVLPMEAWNVQAVKTPAGSGAADLVSMHSPPEVLAG